MTNCSQLFLGLEFLRRTGSSGGIMFNKDKIDDNGKAANDQEDQIGLADICAFPKHNPSPGRSTISPAIITVSNRVT